MERFQLQYMYKLIGNWDKTSWPLGRGRGCGHGEVAIGGDSNLI